MSTIFLKIKLKSLAAEARIIHEQERKTKGAAYNGVRESLHLHRVMDVRRETRATHLAYGFLRGRTWAQIESYSTSPPDWKRVEAMVKKYGVLDERLAAWRDAGPGQLRRARISAPKQRWTAEQIEDMRARVKKYEDKIVVKMAE